MKKLLLQFVALLLFNFTILAQEDWFWVNPLPQGNDLNDVFVLDENTIIAVGDRGTLLRSDNGGDDWEITYRLSNIEENIVDIQFASEQKGYLLSNDPISKILLTDDSGRNWEVIAQFDSLQLNDLFFIDEKIGWAIGLMGDYGIILKTNDGGYTWDTMFMQNINPYWGFFGFSKIQFIDLNCGWATGECFGYSLGQGGSSEFLKTTDGGTSWSIIYDSLDVIESFQFVTPDTGWLVNTDVVGWTLAWYEYSLIKTTDGGLTWENITGGGSMYEEGHTLQYLYFFNSDIGWVRLGYNIKKTTDAGLNWVTLDCNSPDGGAIHFSDEYNGCVVGGLGGILTSQDGGQSWLQRSTMTLGSRLLAVDFCNDEIGWATDYRFAERFTTHRIYNTNDGGASWVEQLQIWVESYEFINDLQAINDQIVYAVVGFHVYKTTNGGANWDIMNYSEDSIFKTLFFLNADTGFVGSNVIYKTTNGGVEWDSVLSIQGNSIESIFYANNSIGWALVKETGSHIYRSNDAGETWLEIATSIFDLKSVCFANENLGLAVGNGGIIIRTTNGGYSWDELLSLEGYELKSVGFTGSNSAIAVGQGDGDGITISIDNVADLNSIKWESWTPRLNDFCFKNNTGWAVGDAGTIIKTGGGTSYIEEENINEIPTNYSLSNNFPNPFNPSTKINYSIPKTSKVMIKVFDILGNKIETLVNEEKPTGTYEITWYAEGLPSGVYFYQFRSGNFVETKKMVLLK